MINSIGTIELEGMEFRAFHGCLDHEKAAGNLFVVDFRGRLEMRLSSQSDRLEDALDYGLIYDCIKKEMLQRSNLLEHVAGRIVRAISSDFPQLESFEVRVSKQRPPVNGVCKWSRITLTYNK